MTGMSASPVRSPVGLDRRTAFVLDLNSWIVVVVMGGLGLWVMPGLVPRLAAAALCLCFGVLDTAERYSRLARRHPVVVIGMQSAVVTALLTLHPQYQDPFAFLFVVLIIRVVMQVGLRVGWAWIAVFWVVSSVAGLWTYGWRDGIYNAVFNLGVYPLCGMVGFVLAALARSTAERDRTLQELQEAQEQLRRVAISEERRRLGRDLHDSVKQQVFASTMQLGAARNLLPDQPERALAAVERAEHAARSAGSELNLVIHELRSADLDHGLPAALDELAGTWSHRAGIEVVRTVDKDIRAPVPIGQGLLRIAQEALANVDRHAAASTVTLALARSGDDLVLTISDDGIGFDQEQPGDGVGVGSMAERAHALGGVLTIDSRPAVGTTVTVRVPGQEE